MSSPDYGFVRPLMRLVASSVLAAVLAMAGCTSSDPGGSGGATGGSGGTGGTAGTGGTGGAGGVGGAEPPPPPQSTPVVFDSGGATIKSDQYQMDVSVSGPVGKGKADSPQFMLDYYVPTSPER